VQERHPALLDAGFSRPDIVKLAANGGGRLALQAVIDHHEVLLGAGVTADQIVAAAAHNGGAKSVQALLDALWNLRHDHPRADELMIGVIEASAKHRGAAGAIQSLVDDFPADAR
jgi:hypothetical protein